MTQLPVFINCRDRITPLRSLVDWLERAGQTEIILIDNDSGYAPLLEYYEQSSHQVVYLGENMGQLAPWNSGLITDIAKDRNFIVTDPDIIPIEECPLDAIDWLLKLVLRYPHKTKVGFGLKIDDLPDCYRFKVNVEHWEAQFWGMNQIEPDVYEAPVDTTFAVYKVHAGPSIGDALRTGFPYLARHMTWYLNSDNPAVEDRYYRERASHCSHWGRADIIPELTAEGQDVLRWDT